MEWKTKAYFIPLIDRRGVEHKVLAYSIGTITSSVDEVDLRPALEEFPELNGDYSKISRPTGSVDLLLGIRDARLHPYLANPDEHCRGDLRLLTSKFGSGYLLDGSHSRIKVEPLQLSSGATERSRGNFTFVKQRGFKRRPRTSHHSQVAMFKAQECVEPEFESKGRPLGGESVSNVSASSFESATTTYNRGSKGPRAGSHKVKEPQNNVFD